MNAVTPFGSNVVVTLATNILLGLFALITGPVVARLLGPSGRGELAAIQNFYWLVASLALLGLPEATLFHSARNKERTNTIVSSGVILFLLVFPVLYGGAYLIAPTMLAAQSASLVKTARWFLLGVPLYGLWIMPTFALRGRNDLVWWNLTRTFIPLGWLLLLLLAKVQGYANPATIAFGYLGVLALSLAPTYWVVRKRIGGTFRPDSRLWPGMVKYGLPLATAEIPVNLNLRLDQVLIAAFMPAGALGLYVVGVAWSGVVPPLLMAIGTVLFPRVASAGADEQKRVLAKGTRISVVAAAVLSLMVAGVAPLAIPLLFGSPFRGAIPAGIVLALAAGISATTVVFEEGARGLGATSSVFWAESGGLGVTLLSLLLLLPRLGILGAAIASLLGYSGTQCFLVLLIKRKLNTTIGELLVPRPGEIREACKKLLHFWSALQLRQAQE